MGTVPGWNISHADGFGSLEDNTGNPGIGTEIQVILDILDTVNVGYWALINSVSPERLTND